MSIVKSGVLAALVVVVALAVVAAPAMATPNNTTSVTQSAPFITPIGNTATSSFTASSPSSSFAVGSLTITCTSTVRGYVPATHTRALLTAVNFPNPCTATVGTVSSVTTTASSTNPWILHARSVSGNSATGTIEIPAGGNASITITAGILGSCSLIVGPQSIDATYTNVNHSLVVADSSVAFTRTGSAACPASGNAAQSGTYTISAAPAPFGTPASALPTVTAAS